MPFDIWNPARQALGWTAPDPPPRLPIETSERYRRLGGRVARASGDAGLPAIAVCVALWAGALIDAVTATNKPWV
jgi:hypothetical protein